MEILQRNEYKEIYFKMLSDDMRSFHRKKGDFTRFVDNHKHMKNNENSTSSNSSKKDILGNSVSYGGAGSVSLRS